MPKQPDDKTMAGMKILVIDDQSDTRLLLRNMLAEIGVTQVFEASGGHEALRFLGHALDRIDFITCDWNMPGMSGMEFLRHLRAIDADMPFLMITARSDIDSVIEAKSAGVTAYIRKPFSSAQLEIKLRTMNDRAWYIS